MVTYVYFHRDCGHSIELDRPMRDRNDPVRCPVCITGVMRRVFTAPTSKVAGLAKDRFKMEDRLAENRQKASDGGWI